MSTLTIQLDSQNHWIADGSQTVWDFNFSGGYINKNHVRAFMESADAVPVRTDITIDYENDFVGPYQLVIEPAVPAFSKLVIYRATPKDLPLVDFQDGGGITEQNLDIAHQQAVFLAQEAADYLGVTTTADLLDLAQESLANAGAAQAAATNAATAWNGAQTSATAAAGSAAASASSATAAANSAAQAAVQVTNLEAKLGDPNTLSSGDAGLAVKKVGSSVGTTQHAVNESRLFDPRTDFGAAGDKVANDLVAVNAAIAAATKELWVPKGDFLVSSTPANTLGVEYKGPGKIRQTIPGGSRQLNVSADTGQHTFGQEYLYFFHTKVWAQFGTASAKVVLSGDSTTFGADAASPFKPHELMQVLGANAGYKIVSVNRGQPGQNTKHWVDSYLAGDMAENADLLILRWGINDPGYLKDGSIPPLDGGQDYANRRDIADFRDSLRTGLSTLRAAKSVAQQSILLMTPNCTSDTPNGRDEVWYEQVRQVVRQAARDFQCAFIDTYALWHDTRNGAATKWMDDPFLDGRAIHPLGIMNAWIYSKVAEFIYPRGLRAPIVPSLVGTQLAGATPLDYKIGMNVAQVATSGGFPGAYDGAVLTLRTADDSAFQMVWPTGSTIPLPAMRFGQGGTWYDYFTANGAGVTLLNGWGVYLGDGGNTVRVNKIMKRVTIATGTISGGTVTAGTVLFNLPPGWRPFAQLWFPCSTNATLSATAHVTVKVNGDVCVVGGVDAGGLCLAPIQFEAYN